VFQHYETPAQTPERLTHDERIPNVGESQKSSSIQTAR
jgi:hypothetical protein